MSDKTADKRTGRDNVQQHRQRDAAEAAQPLTQAHEPQPVQRLMGSLGNRATAQLRRASGGAGREGMLAFLRQGGGAAGADDVAVATQGVSGAGGEVPYRQAMESSFGRSFADVKAHHGPQAVQACSDLGANAYAMGNQVAFSGAPSRRTVAHELTHVVQQQGTTGVQTLPRVTQSGDGYEREADQVADKVVRGESVAGSISRASTPLIQRNTPDGERSKGGGAKSKPKSKTSTEVKAGLPGQKYGFDYVIKISNRWCFKFSLSIERQNRQVVEGKAERSGSKGTGFAGASFLDNSATAKREGGKWGRAVGSSLGKVEAGYKPPGIENLEVSGEVKGPGGEMDLASGKVTPSIATVGVGVKGSLAEKTLKRLGVAAPLAKILVVKLEGNFEYSVPFQDLAKLKKMAETAKKLAETSKKIVAEGKEAARLKQQKKKLDDQIKRRSKGAKSKARKRQLQALRKKARKLNDEITRLERSVRKRGRRVTKLAERFKSISGRLKSKTGRAAAKVLGKAGLKVLGKIAAKFIPGVNIISTVVDLVQIGIAVFKIATGKLKFGGKGGSGKKKKKGRRKGRGRRRQRKPKGPKLSSRDRKILTVLMSKTGVRKVSAEDQKLMADALKGLSAAQVKLLVKRLTTGKKRPKDSEEAVGWVMELAKNVKENEKDGAETVTVADKGKPGSAEDISRDVAPKGGKSNSGGGAGAGKAGSGGRLWELSTAEIAKYFTLETIGGVPQVKKNNDAWAQVTLTKKVKRGGQDFTLLDAQVTGKVSSGGDKGFQFAFYLEWMGDSGNVKDTPQLGFWRAQDNLIIKYDAWSIAGADLGRWLKPTSNPKRFHLPAMTKKVPGRPDITVKILAKAVGVVTGTVKHNGLDYKKIKLTGVKARYKRAGQSICVYVGSTVVRAAPAGQWTAAVVQDWTAGVPKSGGR